MFTIFMSSGMARTFSILYKELQLFQYLKFLLPECHARTVLSQGFLHVQNCVNQKVLSL